MKHWQFKIYIFAEEFFQFSLITYLILLFAETLQTGFVSYFFNLNILLGVVLISGITMLITQREQKEKPLPRKKMRRSDVIYTIFLALGGGLLVYLKVQEIGNIAIIIACITTIIIILLSFLLFMEQK